MICRALLTLGVLLLPACEAPGAPSPPGDDDTPVDACPELPEPSAPCIPECGNELAVGQPCTQGGGECSGNEWPMAMFCTGDFNDQTDLVYCTRPCVVDEDCGSEAICTGDPEDPEAGMGCLPLSCWGGEEGEDNEDPEGHDPAPAPSPIVP